MFPDAVVFTSMYSNQGVHILSRTNTKVAPHFFLIFNETHALQP